MLWQMSDTAIIYSFGFGRNWMVCFSFGARKPS